MKTKTLLPDKSGATQGLLLEREAFFPEMPKLPFHVHLVQDIEEFSYFLWELEKQSWFSFDTETTSKNPRWAKLVGMSFCWSDDEAWYVPVACPKGDHCLSAQYVLECLYDVLSNPGIKKIGQNIKYDKIVLKNYGIDLNGIAFDTLISSYLLDAGSRRHNMDALAEKYLGYKTIHLKDLIGKGKDQIGTKDVPLSCMGPYAAEDTWVVAQLAPILWKESERQQLVKLLEHVEIPLIDVIADIEHTGILVDQTKLAQLNSEFTAELFCQRAAIQEMTGTTFNPNSTDQLRDKLYEEYELNPIKTTDTGLPSTDHQTLVELSDETTDGGRLASRIASFRELSKLKGTYIDPFWQMIHPDTGRIHGSFNQAVTATGRLSSSDPNLQNIPARTDNGKKIREVFVAPEDHLLLSADYSQIELRVLAHYTNDARLREAFLTGEDIHAAVAAQVGDVPLEQVTEQMRKAAKTVNFGIIYGQGAPKLARGIGVSLAAAKIFINKYFQTYPTIRRFKARTIEFCRQHGYVTTILGRRRYIPDINAPEDDPARWTAERMAVNTVIQGSAADIIKLAMLECHNKIKQGVLRAKMLLQIHDELVFEVHKDDLVEVCGVVRETMEDVVPLSVPVKIDLEYGPSWGKQVAFEITDDRQM